MHGFDDGCEAAMKSDSKLKRIAELAGVSIPTVSRVYNHGDQVKQSTRDAVLAAIETLGYDKPSVYCPEHGEVLLVLYPGSSPYYFEEVLKGLMDLCKAYGCEILAKQMLVNENTFPNLVALINRVDVRGCVSLTNVPRGLGKKLSSIVPYIQLCEADIESDIPFVSIDEYTSTKSAINYLLSVTPDKRIAIINDNNSLLYAKAREEAFIKTLEENQVPIVTEWILHVPGLNPDGIYACATHLLGHKDRPSSVFTVSDSSAMIIIKAAFDCGLNVPRDLKVMGFDDLEIARFNNPSITTVKQPCYRLGFSAAEMCIQMMRNKGFVPKSILYNTEIVIRDST